MMTEEEKRLERFRTKPGEFKVIFVPQCNTCDKNINGTSCKEFASIPIDYARNKVDCPLFVAWQMER